MKMIKIMAGILVVIVVLFLVVAAVAPSEFGVEKQVTIEKPVADVFGYIKFIKNMDNYSVWAAMDPDMKQDYSGDDGTVGFISRWESDNPRVGTGEQEITGLVENSRVDMELRFKVPFESTSSAFLTTEAISDASTLVKWGFSGGMPYPMNIMMLFMDMEAEVGANFSDGLANLKSLLEAIPGVGAELDTTVAADSAMVQEEGIVADE